MRIRPDILLANVSSLGVIGLGYEAGDRWSCGRKMAIARSYGWSLAVRWNTMTATADISPHRFLIWQRPPISQRVKMRSGRRFTASAGEGKICVSRLRTRTGFSGLRPLRSFQRGETSALSKGPRSFYLLRRRPSRHRAPPYEIFGDDQTDFRESHAILDFQAGKDVGFGLFGAHGSSVVSAGVRFAQFTTRPMRRCMHGPLYLGIATVPGKYRLPHQFRKTNAASFDAKRNTQTVGPSLSRAAFPAGCQERLNMTLDFDWGATLQFCSVGSARSSITKRPVPIITNMAERSTRAVTCTCPSIKIVRGPSRFQMSEALQASRSVIGRQNQPRLSRRFLLRRDGWRHRYGARGDVGFYGPFATIGVGIGRVTRAWQLAPVLRGAGRQHAIAVDFSNKIPPCHHPSSFGASIAPQAGRVTPPNALGDERPPRLVPCE